MKSNKFKKNKLNVSALKKLYYITLENAKKKTQGREGNKLENNINLARYADHAP